MFLRFYLFIHERHTERGRDTGRGRSRLPAGSPMQDLTPGPRDHDLSQTQTLKHWATQAPTLSAFLKAKWPNIHNTSWHMEEKWDDQYREGEGRYCNLISLIFWMLIKEFMGEFCLREACQSQRLLNRFLNTSPDLVCATEDRWLMLILGKKTTEGAKGGNFIRFRPRTTFGSANTVFL